MAALRMFGLLFFMTILVSGCMMAVAAAPPSPPPITKSYQVVSWEQAVEILHQGQVRSVAQTHSLRVFLLLKDGTYLVTNEPYLNAIYEVIDACGQACEGISLSAGLELLEK